MPQPILHIYTGRLFTAVVSRSVFPYRLFFSRLNLFKVAGIHFVPDTTQVMGTRYSQTKQQRSSLSRSLFIEGDRQIYKRETNKGNSSGSGLE